jgi:hypothetical protein
MNTISGRLATLQALIRRPKPKTSQHSQKRSTFVFLKGDPNQLLVALTAVLAVKWFAVRKHFQGALWPIFNFLAPPAP